MNARAVPWIITAAAAALVACWLLRYEVIGDGQRTFRLDRWTGEVCVVQPSDPQARDACWRG